MPERLRELPEEVKFSVNLSKSIRMSVMSVYGIKEQGVPINQVSHDFNYAVDTRSEATIRQKYIDRSRKGVIYGYASEDQGLMVPAGATHIQLIDPVDGSRTAMIGAEMACVQIVGVAGNKTEAAFEDIEFGITHAIKENRIFIGLRDQGVWEVGRGKLVPVTLGQKSNNLEDASLVFESYSISLEQVGKVMDPLLREVHFATLYPSGSYSALTLVRGQNELHADVRKRLLIDHPELPLALKANVLPKPVMPMDVAAGWLMIRELGGVVTDAYGQPLDKKRLWEFNPDGSWSENNQISWVAGVTPELHAKAMAKIEEGFARLK